MIVLCLSLSLTTILAPWRAGAQEDSADAGPSSPSAAQPVNLPGRVVGDLDLRSAPVESEDTFIRTVHHNDPVWVFDQLAGEDGDVWYRVQDDGYVRAGNVRLPQAPPQVFSGRWLDVALTVPALITAYEDDRAVASGLAIKGRVADETPEGIYTILWRVYDETMDSETLGIPRDDPDGYYLEHVLYTQYFTEDGDSVHYNWWSSDLGAEGSRGCLGLGLDDAQWLWDWADVGTVISIHG